MKHSQKFLQQRKFFMVLPLLALPFLTMIFWALGGGKGTPAQAQVVNTAGLNLELPNAQFQNTTPTDKLSLYREAEQDSVKFFEAWQQDALLTATMPPSNSFNTSFSTSTTRDVNEEKVNAKLNQLYQELNRTTVTTTAPSQTTLPADPQFSQDINRLEQLMIMMNSGETTNPEIQQLDGILDKILNIQNPDRIQQESPAQQQPTHSVLPVTNTLQISSFNTTDHSTNQTSQPSNDFFGLSDNPGKDSTLTESIQAVIHETRQLVTGATIKMRLTAPVEINGIHIPSGHFIHGICSIDGERLKVKINSIRFDDSIIPVSLSIFDLDGLEGIYIPGAISREVAKESTGQALDGMQFSTFNPSLTAQATSAGLQAVTSLFSKKTRLTKVIVKAGYSILIRNA